MTLREIADAQEDFRERTVVDQDGDGRGEYGWLGELAGIDPARGVAEETAREPRWTPIIASILGVKDDAGIPQESGFCFRLYLPVRGGRPTGEAKQPTSPSDPRDADGQESHWACYAWPTSATVMDRPRAFFVNERGVVYVTQGEHTAYVGPADPPPPLAAFAADASGAAGLGSVPAGTAARLVALDGNVWVPAR